MVYFEFFNNSSNSLYSTPERLYPGSVLEVSAFYLEGKDPANLKFEEDYVTVYKNDEEEIDIIEANDCCIEHINKFDLYKRQYNIKSSLKIMQGGSWTLTKCQNFVYIITPGLFTLELSDKCMIGRVKVVGNRYGWNEIKKIPSDLVFGNLT